MVSSANPTSPKQNALMNTPLSGHAVGIILKEPMRRAIVTIRNERQVFEGTVKRGYQGDMDDVFTSADTKAQAVYLKSLRQCFPDIPVIAAEGTTALGTASPTYFTVDPGRRVPDKVALDACDRRALDAAVLIGGTASQIIHVFRAL
jgi:hypothetical protein